MAVLDDILEACDALCQPRLNKAARWGWDDQRHKKSLDPWETTQPGLIQQLRDMAEPGCDGEPGGRGGPESVPVAIDAVSLLAAITFGARMRAAQWGVNLSQRASVEDYLRGLVGAVGRRPHDDARVLRSELRSWAWQAEIVTGWRTPPKDLPAPCPQCEAPVGNLLAYADPTNPRAKCLACGARWAEAPERDEGSIRVLGEHVNGYAGKSMAERKRLRAEAVTERRRRNGEVEPERMSA